MDASSVLFPAPTFPTTATRLPLGTCRSTPDSDTFFSSPPPDSVPHEKLPFFI